MSLAVRVRDPSSGVVALHVTHGLLALSFHRSLFYDLCWPTPQYFPHFQAVADTPLAPEQLLEAAKDSFQDAMSVAGGILRMPADRLPADARATLQGWQKAAMTNIIAMGLMVKARAADWFLSGDPASALRGAHCFRTRICSSSLRLLRRLRAVARLIPAARPAAARSREREPLVRLLNRRGVPNGGGQVDETTRAGCCWGGRRGRAV